MRRAAAVYSILMGLAMLGYWITTFLRGKTAEVTGEPLETTLLLIDEFLTASFLIFAGSGLLARRLWGLPASLAALGMLLYCVILTCGIFGQAGNPAAAVFFAVTAVLAVLFIFTLIRETLHDFGTIGDQTMRSRRSKYNHINSEECHPERSEGSRSG